MTSDEALEDDTAINWAMANRELKRHGALCYQPQALAMREQIQVCMDGIDEPWDTIRCSRKAILEWLGY